MKTYANHISFSGLMGLLLIGTFFACNKSSEVLKTAVDSDVFVPALENGQVIPGQYIVVLHENTLAPALFKRNMTYDERNVAVAQFAHEFMSENVVADPHTVVTFNKVILGFAAHLSAHEVEKLQKNPKVKYIEQDKIIALGKPENPGKGGGGGPSQPAQETPWGITRVGGAASGVGKRAWIIDTGIELDHPDLNVNTTLSRSFLSGKAGQSANDENGHGTHVAGTVAALNNDIGVIGVAAGAEVVAVRVLDRRGSGTTSGVIAGVDYVAANASDGDAANMSLGGGVSSTLDAAVFRASAQTSPSKSIYFALAAGNDNDNANNSSPARVNGANIFTVTAMNSSDYMASWSNYGNPPVDFCAPGVSIQSCWINAGYNTISGTSMAAPHVCGILLLTNGAPTTSGYVKGDKDSSPDPIAHK